MLIHINEVYEYGFIGDNKIKSFNNVVKKMFLPKFTINFRKTNTEHNNNINDHYWPKISIKLAHMPTVSYVNINANGTNYQKAKQWILIELANKSLHQAFEYIYNTDEINRLWDEESIVRGCFKQVYDIFKELSSKKFYIESNFLKEFYRDNDPIQAIMAESNSLIKTLSDPVMNNTDNLHSKNIELSENGIHVDKNNLLKSSDQKIAILPEKVIVSTEIKDNIKSCKEGLNEIKNDNKNLNQSSSDKSNDSDNHKIENETINIHQIQKSFPGIALVNSQKIDNNYELDNLQNNILNNGKNQDVAINLNEPSTNKIVPNNMKTSRKIKSIITNNIDEVSNEQKIIHDRDPSELNIVNDGNKEKEEPELDNNFVNSIHKTTQNRLSECISSIIALSDECDSNSGRKHYHAVNEYVNNVPNQNEHKEFNADNGQQELNDEDNKEDEHDDKHNELNGNNNHINEVDDPALSQTSTFKFQNSNSSKKIKNSFELYNDKFRIHQKLYQFRQKPNKLNKPEEQKFKCYSCINSLNKWILLINPKSGYCHYTGYWYCNQCISKEKKLIPWYILENWDFKLYTVSKISKQELDKLYDKYAIQIDINMNIVRNYKILYETLVMKRQLHLIYDMICSTFLLSELIESNGNILIKENLFSIKNLYDIHNGSLYKHLEYWYFVLRKHIMMTCEICQAKGKICNICQSTQYKLYPFDIRNTAFCKKCKRFYHAQCLQIKSCIECL